MLYEVERRADEEELSFDERSDLRSRLSYPIMVAFEKWLVNEYAKVLPKGRMGKAIRYIYEIYHRLTRYHLDGRYQIDRLYWICSIHLQNFMDMILPVQSGIIFVSETSTHHNFVCIFYKI